MSAQHAKRIEVPVTLTTVACEGVGLDAKLLSELRRRAKVTVRFAIELGDGPVDAVDKSEPSNASGASQREEQVSLPGAVAWVGNGQLGVHLLLELALPAVRQRWGRWIVGRTAAFRSRRQTNSL